MFEALKVTDLRSDTVVSSRWCGFSGVVAGRFPLIAMNSAECHCRRRPPEAVCELSAPARNARARGSRTLGVLGYAGPLVRWSNDSLCVWKSVGFLCD